jgi:hypothetical protein
MADGDDPPGRGGAAGFSEPADWGNVGAAIRHRSMLASMAAFISRKIHFIRFFLFYKNLSPVPEPEPVIVDQLKAEAIFGQIQVDERQVQLMFSFAGAAEDAVKRVAHVFRRVEQLQHGTAELALFFGVH